MPSFNQCTFIGNLTRDAESRQVGEAEVARYAIAINGRKDKTGNTKVMYMDCDHWRPGGVLPYLTTGTPVAVTGELERQTWKKDGEEKWKFVLNVRQLQLLGGKKKDSPVEEEFAEFRA